MNLFKQIKRLYRNIQSLDYSSNYNEQLEDERWKEKRQEILAQHNYTCDWCGSHENLQVHHKYYQTYPNNLRIPAWNYPDKCFMCLCRKCHEKYHQKYKVPIFYRKY